MGDDGQISVLLSGTHELANLDSTQTEIGQRLATESRPVDAVRTKSGVTLVANQFSDSISGFQSDPKGKMQEFTIALGDRPELSLAQRGEMLFFDGRLSHDGWMSCHSCHTNGHSNGQLNDNFSDDSFGTPKRVLSLLGVRDTGPWAWNGRTETLQQQVRNSVVNTMRGTNIEEDSVEAIVAFMKTLELPRFDPHPASTGADIAEFRAAGKATYGKSWGA